ncbi:MAG: NAD(P)/FAD-dependent oxidoreductase [Paramuribaculum sp.]|nr:NAD(P)/FAD-dependent oxidoreductase [Paramuribaculum sp.]MDE6587649.1 NAD(P)/FAD-dependent oxidoreductase [Paramuribaculum sp.]MDE7236244.1 NAD(P)/FAD-dependent oxidoreductase [Paramuribaculum sp.]
MTAKERIVIVGGGFAGLNLTKYLDKDRFEITLVDRNNFHSFPPLFYQIASGGLDPGNISFPFRRELRKLGTEGLSYHMGDVHTIDVLRKEVRTQFETIEYDKLVICAGTTNNFFGNPELIKNVFTMKSAAEATRCRNEILDRLERASLCPDDPQRRRRLLSFVVVGGGPTGVEIAGAIGELKRYILQREYPGINSEDLQIILLEGTDRVLGPMSPQASEEALKYLKDLMVDVRLGKLLETYRDNVITLKDGSTIYAEMVLWTAGVTGETFLFEGTDYRPGRGNRFEVDEQNRVKGLTDIFAVGDIACMITDKYPKGHPQLAQPAIQQARHLAHALNTDTWDKPFVYKDKGSMATVGRNLAVADLNNGVHLKGTFAWFAWMFVHLISLLGMRNKLTVLINWVWAYFTYSTSLRMLLHSTKFPLRHRWGER